MGEGQLADEVVLPFAAAMGAGGRAAVQVNVAEVKRPYGAQ